MGSSRLPGKILKPILDKPMLARMIERVRASKHIQGIVVATTNAKADDATEAFCQANSIACYRGSEIDVLDRVLQAARFMDADWIVQLTGDCPFIDGRLLDEPIQICLSQSDSWDFFSSPLDDSGLPRGTGLRMFPLSVLERVSQMTQDTSDHEHVSTYIYANPNIFRLGLWHPPNELERPELRLTVDTEADLALTRGVYEALYKPNHYFGLDDIIKLLDSREDLKALNAHVQQKPIRPETLSQ